MANIEEIKVYGLKSPKLINYFSITTMTFAQYLFELLINDTKCCFHVKRWSNDYWIISVVKDKEHGNQ